VFANKLECKGSRMERKPCHVCDSVVEAHPGGLSTRHFTNVQLLPPYLTFAHPHFLSLLSVRLSLPENQTWASCNSQKGGNFASLKQQSESLLH
jgi:hypothetical protein